MLDNRNNRFILSLRQMLLCCQEMQNLLKKDKKNFSKNDLPAIEESNRRKSEVLQLLNTLAESISQPDQSASEPGSESQQELNVINILRLTAPLYSQTYNN